MSSLHGAVFPMKLYHFFKQAKMIVEVWKKMGGSRTPFLVFHVGESGTKNKNTVFQC